MGDHDYLVAACSMLLDHAWRVVFWAFFGLFVVFITFWFLAFLGDLAEDRLICDLEVFEMIQKTSFWFPFSTLSYDCYFFNVLVRFLYTRR